MFAQLRATSHNRECCVVADGARLAAQDAGLEVERHEDLGLPATVYLIGYRAIRSPVIVPIQISLATCRAAVELKNRSVAG